MSHKWLRMAAVGLFIGAVSLLHYHTTTHRVWLHMLFQRGYYLPLLLAALWFGWRGGVISAALAGLLYAPHIVISWASQPEYRITQYLEIVMFFVVGGMAGLLADRERQQRLKAEAAAKQLAEVNRQLQTSFEQLRRADRLSALGQLSAGLAHEIRNPLGSVEGAVQILRRPELPLNTREEFGELAQKEVNRLKDLLTHFLHFARPRPPHRQPTDLRSLLESVRILAADTARMAKGEIRVEADEELPVISVDPEQIKQVLLNLVLNAIQAMPNGGTVLLRAARRDHEAFLEVRDGGIGIAPEDLERIFDPFFTRREGGTGLGLSIAYQIVEQHGGRIEARRNAESGTSMIVTLPLVRPESPLRSDQ